MPKIRPFASLCLAFLVFAASAGFAKADLPTYVKTPDPAFSWKIKSKTEIAEGTVYDLHLVSQVWQKITWEHQLQVFLPKNVKPTATMFLWNQGGKAGATSTLFGMELARKMNAPVAILYGVPNQPLFNGKTEDALIAETFVRYLETKDETWPLLFPMVKSLARAMDALQAFAKQEWNIEVTHFVVSGASKRGWTSWLTAAVDARVKAFAPCVIDILNMQAQLPYQLKSYGAYSEQIADYTKRGLVPPPDTPEGRKLWSMVDPWVYRDRLKKPTMIINGSNDPYWTQDALNLYWDDLPGEKWILYVPNAEHNLVQKHDAPTLIPDRTRALNTLAAFARHQIHDLPMPKLKWQHEGANPKMQVKIQSDPTPKAARLWSTEAATRDFRKSKWKSQPMDIKAGSLSADMAAPEKGFTAFFAELEYEIGGYTYYLSTQLRIAPQVAQVETSSRERGPETAKAAPGGRLLLLNQSKWELLTPEGKKIADVAGPAKAGAHDAAISPDGKRVAFIAMGRPSMDKDGNFNRHIFIRELDTKGDGTKIDITAQNISWTPEGKLLAVEAATTKQVREGDFTTWLVDVATKEQTRLDMPRATQVFAATPDGKSFLAMTHAADAKKSQLSLLARDGKSTVKLTEVSGRVPAMFVPPKLSPNGSRVLFLDIDPDEKADKDAPLPRMPRLFVYDLKTEKRQRLADAPLNGFILGYAWSPDSQKIAYSWKRLEPGVPLAFNLNDLKNPPAKTEIESHLVVVDADGRNVKTIVSAKANSGPEVTLGGLDWR